MAEKETQFKPTKGQAAAMNIKADRILVSAAAGSGKSTVLTNRIINAITDSSRHYDLEKLMVVTFTRASAEDLRAKITKAIKETVEKDPNNKHLSDQLMKLPAARINTIHGICYSIVKSNFDMFEPPLPASVSIADENAVSSLRIEVMNSLLDYCYSGLFAPILDFECFVENFITERDDKLVTIFLDIYDKMKNHPDGFDNFDSNIYNGDGDFLTTPFGKSIYNRLFTFTDYYLEVFNAAIVCFEKYPVYTPLIVDYRSNIEYLRAIQNALDRRDFTLVGSTIRDLKPTKLNFRLPSKDLSVPEAEYYRAERKNFVDALSEIVETVFIYTPEQIKHAGKCTADISEKLTAFMKEFDRHFTEAKRKRSYLDFNDLEHYTLNLLYNSNGSVSDFAMELSSEITEIFVDEYQDLNPLQNKIFKALSVKCPIFMVGDIKQSIYGFRGADPSAFAEYKRLFPEYTDSVTDYRSVTVFLSENFRSSEPIINFSNAVSDAMFYTPSGKDFVYGYRIPYTEGDRLKYGLAEAPADPEVRILNCVSERVTGGNPIPNAAMRLQAQMVANEISRLIRDGNSPEDIAVIFRNGKTNIPIFEEALKKLNIPIDATKGTKLFDTPEIQLALCLLNCCENPYKDIYLTGALRSPIFGFTLDELIMIKRENAGAASLFDALTSYTEKHSFEKGRYFLEFLSRIRKYAMENTVDRLLWQIYTETSFFSIIYDGTVTESVAMSRRSNLLKLHEMAKGMTEAGKSGLYAFVERIRLLIEQDESPTAAETVGSGVKMMTMHASKGLEFKYCFVCGLSQAMKNDDLHDDILYDAEIGFSAKIKDNLRLTCTDTPYRLALSYKAETEWVDEEMRMLYVAMTRARVKLYLCSSIAGFDAAVEKHKLMSKHIHPYLFMTNKGFMKWILIALGRLEGTSVVYTQASLSKDEIEATSASAYLSADDIKGASPEISNDATKAFKDDIIARLTYEYPHKNALILPSKLSVSKLYPEILDSDNYFGHTTEVSADEIANFDISTQKSGIDNTAKLKTPDFALNEISASGAERGTATHIFMQFCDFDNLQKSGAEAEINRLLEKRFILPAHAEIIDRSVIETFLNTDIFKEMMNAGQLNREYRFNIKLPADEFTASPELKERLKDEFIFVQGVIDCYFRDKNGDITLLDYKTDYVPKNIRGDIERENNFFIQKHAKQLTYYKKALKILTLSEVKRTVIFSFALGRCIEIY